MERSDIFLTTKIMCGSYHKAAGQIDDNLRQLGMRSVNLSLIHFDRCFGGGVSFFDAATELPQRPAGGEASGEAAGEAAAEAAGEAGEEPPLHHHRLLLVHPPLSPKPLPAMIPTLEAILAQSRSSGVSMTALVVIPSGLPSDLASDASDYHRAVDASPYHLGSATLAAGEHAEPLQVAHEAVEAQDLCIQRGHVGHQRRQAVGQFLDASIEHLLGVRQFDFTDLLPGDTLNHLQHATPTRRHRR